MPKKSDPISFTLVDAPRELEKACSVMQKEPILGIDLECENGLHHYGTYLSTIQVSSRTMNWIIDALMLKDLTPIIRVLEDGHITKIFHDVGFDFGILAHEHQCRPKNIFDTQMAALLLGREGLGLGALLTHHFNIEKDGFQKADWTKRPLSKEMLQYAIKDTYYLIRLKELLQKELEQLGRLDWFRQECKALEEKGLLYSDPTYEDITGYQKMTPQQRGIVKELYKNREKLAQKLDKPAHFVLGNKKILEILREPPETVEGWKNMRGVHPAVRNQASRFFSAQLLGKEHPITVPKQETKRLSPRQRKYFDELSLVQERIAKKHGIAKHLIMNREQMIALATGDESLLRPWQKELVRAEEKKSGRPPTPQPRKR